MSSLYSQKGAITAFFAIALFAFNSGYARLALAETALTAGVVSEKMSREEQTAYISGVVEGLAYGRFLRDRPDETGMRCIYDWFYNRDGKGLEPKAKWRKIDAWFRRHPNQTVGVLLHVLIKQECGV